MTVTIKEITDKFYEVIDKYEEHEDWWEPDISSVNKALTPTFDEIGIHTNDLNDDFWQEINALKIKREYIIPFRTELEQVAISFLEKSDDDFMTAFAAFCTCVIRYDLVEKDDWTYFDALMSVVNRMSESVWPEYFDDSDADEFDEFETMVKKTCELIAKCEFRNPDYLNNLFELCEKWSPSFLFLWFFCAYSQQFCAEEISQFYELVNLSEDDLQTVLDDLKQYRNDYFHLAKAIYNAMDDDFKEYAFGTGKYSIKSGTSIDNITDRRLLPFLYIGSLTGDIANKLFREYNEIRDSFSFSKDKFLTINNINAFLNDENTSEDDKEHLCVRLNLLLYLLDNNNFRIESNFGKIQKREDENGTIDSVYDSFIRREISLPLQRTGLILIPAIIPTPDFFKELLDKNVALDNALESKEKLIRDFSHRFKNLRTTSLQNVGKALLAMDDKTLKKYGRKVLLEYGEKENIIKEVEILRLRYEDQQDQLLTLLHESQSEEPDGCNGITGTVNKAVTRCVTTLLFDASDEPKLIRKSCLNNFDIVLLRNTFEEKVLYLEKPDAILWLNDYIMPVHFSFSDAWTKLYFKQDRGLDIILADLMTDLIMNAIKYADKSQVTSFDFTEEEDLLMIKTENMSVENKDDIPGSNTGLRSQNELLNYLNSACGYDNDSITVDSLPDDSFRAEIRLSRKIFTEDR